MRSDRYYVTLILTVYGSETDAERIGQRAETIVRHEFDHSEVGNVEVSDIEQDGSEESQS